MYQNGTLGKWNQTQKPAICPRVILEPHPLPEFLDLSHWLALVYVSWSSVFIITSIIIIIIILLLIIIVIIITFILFFLFFFSACCGWLSSGDHPRCWLQAAEPGARESGGPCFSLVFQASFNISQLFSRFLVSRFPLKSTNFVFQVSLEIN